MKHEIGQLLLENYRLTTAEILYRLPDHPSLLQSYVWQDLDLNPDFPVLRKFLNFWERELDGRLYSVKVASCDIIKPSEFCFTHGIIAIH
jgi:uncharacterized protein Usg